MRKSTLNMFGSEWFGIAISTLALSQIYILSYGETGNVWYNYLAEAFSITGIILFLVILVIWIIRGLAIRDKVFTHWNNLTRLSFVALIPIIGFVANYQLIYFFGLSEWSADLSVLNFYGEYLFALIIGVLLGYRLYTKEINPREMNYAIVIPPLAIGTSVFLATPLMKYFGGFEAQSMYFLVLMGLGIFFFLYIFIGSLALSGHVTTKVHDTLPTTMLPVGIASLIIINIFTISGFKVIGNISLSASTVELVSILLWGFEVWNFLVVLLLILTKPSRGTLSVWAYGFPLGLFATSTMKIFDFTSYSALLWAFIGISAALNILWVYAWINTVSFIRSKLREEVREKNATVSGRIE
ncbi:MAG: C4-dicarboxylate ABC transporter [Cuniculiplasma sp. C_DKE]|nr:MAG: C4-dicarboxylate ABC transporter [Cuniculiplasma sp. C_DKE]